MLCNNFERESSLWTLISFASQLDLHLLTGWYDEIIELFAQNKDTI